MDGRNLVGVMIPASDAAAAAEPAEEKQPQQAQIAQSPDQLRKEAQKELQKRFDDVSAPGWHPVFGNSATARELLNAIQEAENCRVEVEGWQGKELVRKAKKSLPSVATRVLREAVKICPRFAHKDKEDGIHKVQWLKDAIEDAKQSGVDRKELAQAEEQYKRALKIFPSLNSKGSVPKLDKFRSMAKRLLASNKKWLQAEQKKLIEDLKREKEIMMQKSREATNMSDHSKALLQELSKSRKGKVDGLAEDFEGGSHEQSEEEQRATKSIPTQTIRDLSDFRKAANKLFGLGVKSSSRNFETSGSARRMACKKKAATEKEMIGKPYEAFHFSKKRDSALDTLLPGYARSLNAVAWEIGCHIASQYEEAERKLQERERRKEQKAEEAEIRRKRRWISQVGLDPQSTSKEAVASSLFVDTQGDGEDCGASSTVMSIDFHTAAKRIWGSTKAAERFKNALSKEASLDGDGTQEQDIEGKVNALLQSLEGIDTAEAKTMSLTLAMVANAPQYRGQNPGSLRKKMFANIASESKVSILNSRMESKERKSKDGEENQPDFLELPPDSESEGEFDIDANAVEMIMSEAAESRSLLPSTRNWEPQTGEMNEQPGQTGTVPDSLQSLESAAESAEQKSVAVRNVAQSLARMFEEEDARREREREAAHQKAKTASEMRVENSRLRAQLNELKSMLAVEEAHPTLTMRTWHAQANTTFESLKEKLAEVSKVEEEEKEARRLRRMTGLPERRLRRKTGLPEEGEGEEGFHDSNDTKRSSEDDWKSWTSRLPERSAKSPAGAALDLSETESTCELAATNSTRMHKGGSAQGPHAGLVTNEDSPRAARQSAIIIEPVTIDSDDEYPVEEKVPELSDKLPSSDFPESPEISKTRKSFKSFSCPLERRSLMPEPPKDDEVGKRKHSILDPDNSISLVELQSRYAEEQERKEILELQLFLEEENREQAREEARQRLSELLSSDLEAAKPEDLMSALNEARYAGVWREELQQAHAMITKVIDKAQAKKDLRNALEAGQVTRETGQNFSRSHDALTKSVRKAEAHGIKGDLIHKAGTLRDQLITEECDRDELRKLLQARGTSAKKLEEWVSRVRARQQSKQYKSAWVDVYCEAAQQAIQQMRNWRQNHGVGLNGLLDGKLMLKSPAESSK